MKQWIFVAMVAVSSLGLAENSTPVGTHAGDVKGPRKAVNQSQAPKVDVAAKLNEIVNACLLGQGNSKSNGNLGRSSK